MSSLLKLPIIRNFYNRYAQKRAAYLKDNREEVLFLFRKLRKAIPPTIDRELVRQAKIEELKWLFKESKNERFMENIDHSKKIAYEALKKIETGEYPPYPTYSPSPNNWYLGLKDDEQVYIKDKI